MQVTGFVGSPRPTGNTSVLVDTFLAGAADAGADTERVFLADKEINQCQGCYRSCIMQPGFRCARYRDDMDQLLELMVASDVLMFASPYYCGSYSAIMARFFERCLPLWHVEVAGEMGTMEAFTFVGEPPLKGKRAVIGLVQDFKDPATGRRGVEIFQENLGLTHQMQIAATIHVTDVRDPGDITQRRDVLDHAFALGRQLAGN